MTKRRTKPGKAALDALGYHKGPDTLERDLAGYFSAFRQTPKNDRDAAGVCFAFLSILMIYAAMRKGAAKTDRHDKEWGLPPEDVVPVPWWVIDVATRGWVRYLRSPPSVSLGEAYGIEGGGQGRHPYKNRIATYTRDWKIALDVWHRVQQAKKQGEKLPIRDGAIPAVAVALGFEESTVERAWKRHGKMIKAAYQNWTKTSGSSDHD